MSTEDNKAAARRGLEEIWNQGNLAGIDEAFAPNFVYHDPGAPNVRTREDYKQYATETRSAFPDLRITLDDMIAEGDQVVMRCTIRGTHTGDILKPTRIPATGKRVTVAGITIARSVDGKVIEIWNQSDDLGMLQQLGLIPELQSVN